MVRKSLVLCCALIVAGAVSTRADDWPQWRGPHRDGKSTESGLNLNWKRKKPQHLWTVEGMGRGFASLSIADGRIYTTGNLREGQGVVCADAATGRRLWATPLTGEAPEHGYPGSRCTPTVDGDRVYVVTSDGQIVCLQTSNGNVLWRRSFKADFGGRMMSGWGFSESPLVDGDWVLCTPGGRNAMIVALDKRTGADVWQASVPSLGENGKDGAGYSSIVISEAAGVKQYVQLTGRGVISVRANDGKFLWGYNRVANNVANIPTPIVKGDYVFASTGYGTGAALLKVVQTSVGLDVEEEYFLDSKIFQNHHGGMILLGDYIYAGHQHNKGFPICLHMMSGNVKWGGRIRPEGGGSAAITYVDGDLLFRYQDGVIALIAASPKGYELKGTFTPEYQEAQSWSHPVVVDGKLYLREQDKLMCYAL